jgi:hypothetical protein
MEYGEAITSNAAEKAYSIARKLLANRPGELRSVAVEAVAKAYCVCVVDGEDTAEGHASAIHAKLINEVELRLRECLHERGLD